MRIPNDSDESLGAFLTIRPPELDGGKFSTDIYQFLVGPLGPYPASFFDESKLFRGKAMFFFGGWPWFFVDLGH